MKAVLGRISQAGYPNKSSFLGKQSEGSYLMKMSPEEKIPKPWRLWFTH